MIREVKICGLTNPSDAAAAIDAGASALGINLWSGSKRYLPLEEADWLADLGSSVARVAVLVNPALGELSRIVESGWFDWIQLHGDEDEAFLAAAARLGLPVIKALRVRDAAILAEARILAERFPVLLDSFHGSMPGGTGATWDWSIAAAFSTTMRGRPWILSGGLNFVNITDACAAVQPPVVDVASGVERPGNPRSKDPSAMRRFVESAQEGASEMTPFTKLFDRDTAKKRDSESISLDNANAGVFSA